MIVNNNNKMEEIKNRNSQGNLHGFNRIKLSGTDYCECNYIHGVIQGLFRGIYASGNFMCSVYVNNNIIEGEKHQYEDN